MKRPTFIARQSSRPSGALGHLIAWIMERETAELNEHALQLLALSTSDRVLEVGFGHGRTIERLAAAVTGGHIAGVDVSESMTRLATRRNQRAVAEGRVDLRTGDAAVLLFEDGSFDAVLSVHTVYFWRDPLACLREIKRVLRAPKGRFVLGFTPSDSQRAASFPGDVYTFYSDEQIRALLSAAGFTTIAISRVSNAALALATT